jgi:AGCS family alanine or glycine:cation symporter
MTIPNLVALLLLSGVIAADTKYYLKDKHIDDVDETPIPLLSEIRKKK